MISGLNVSSILKRLQSSGPRWLCNQFALVSITITNLTIWLPTAQLFPPTPISPPLRKLSSMLHTISQPTFWWIYLYVLYVSSMHAGGNIFFSVQHFLLGNSRRCYVRINVRLTDNVECYLVDIWRKRAIQGNPNISVIQAFIELVIGGMMTTYNTNLYKIQNCFTKLNQ